MLKSLHKATGSLHGNPYGLPQSEQAQAAPAAIPLYGRRNAHGWDGVKKYLSHYYGIHHGFHYEYEYRHGSRQRTHYEYAFQNNLQKYL